jgi:hypothetical protein
MTVNIDSKQTNLLQQNCKVNLNLQIMTIKESNVTINVKDLDKSISFYESIGLTNLNRYASCLAAMLTCLSAGRLETFWKKRTEKK